MDIGGVYGKFEIRREIAHGGMGVLYEAWDTVLCRRVALKAIHPHHFSDPTFVQQFLVEARSAAAVEHPNIIHIHGIESIDGQTVIDMEYVDGTSLSELLSFGPLTPFHTVEILIQLLEALSACHRQGIVHCDLKPSNVIITPQGRAMLTDFGLASALESKREATGANLRWGTPAYSPPEAWSGGPVAPTWDIYCVGVLAYECITGHVPRMGPAPNVSKQGITTRISLAAHQGEQEGFSAEDQEEGIGILEAGPPALSMTSPELDKLIQAMLALDPAARPKDAESALHLLRHTTEALRRSHHSVPLAAGPPDPFVERRRDAAGSTRSRRWWYLGVGLAALVLGTLLMAQALQGLRRSDSPEIQSASLRISEAPPYSSSPEEMTLSGEFIYFSADDGVHGREPFAGEPSGGKTHLMMDVTPGPGSSNPHGFKPYRGGVLFVADSPDTGTELWWGGWSVGSSFTVRLIKDIIPGPLGTNPEIVAVLGTVALFYATTPDDGRELWSTMGEASTTAMVKDVFAGAGDSVPTSPRLAVSGDIAYIVALTDATRGNCLWRYHATDNSLTLIGDVFEGAQYLTILGDRIVFAQADAAHGNELWLSVAPLGVPTLLADLVPGTEGSRPTELFAWRDFILFQASALGKGRELWRTDGTAGGTSLLRDIAAGPEGSDPYGFVAGDDGVFFSADSGAQGRELWFTDGTAEHTELVADVHAGKDSSGPYNIVPGHDGVVFSADDGMHGEELWYAHRGAEGWQAQLVKDIFPGPGSSEPYGFRWENTVLGVFSATGPDTGRELYVLHVVNGEPRIRLCEDLYPEPN